LDKLKGLSTEDKDRVLSDSELSCIAGCEIALESYFSLFVHQKLLKYEVNIFQNNISSVLSSIGHQAEDISF
jgi:hypothetical protein